MPEPLHIGFTGTRDGCQPKQLETLRRVLTNLRHEDDGPREFHYGDCIGADKEAFEIARENKYVTTSHPPTDDRYRAFTTALSIMPPAPYLERNHNIVDATDFMIACPREFNEVLRSGTWATIRYAQRTRKNVGIIFPDGSQGLYNG